VDNQLRDFTVIDTERAGKVKDRKGKNRLLWKSAAGISQ